jgi:hypothetical protein
VGPAVSEEERKKDTGSGEKRKLGRGPIQGVGRNVARGPFLVFSSFLLFFFCFPFDFLITFDFGTQMNSNQILKFSNI